MSDEIAKAVEVLKRGGIVAFPTETVYGLGGDATNEGAIGKIFAAKGRPGTNPLIVHVADTDVAKKYAEEWPGEAQNLAERFWPGPLTLILPKGEAIVGAVTAGRRSVGLRVPNHPIALELLREFGGAVAAPSANRSTRVSPTTAEHVREELGDAVDFVLDGGSCSVGIESTVLDLTTRPATILRPGAVSKEEIEAIIGPVGFFTGAVDASVAAASPGQQGVHYAPRAAAYRVEAKDLKRVRKIKNSAVLSIEPEMGDVQMPNEAGAYAKLLYATLRDCDSRGVENIFIQMPPERPEWVAVCDRIRRATRPL